MFIVRDLVLGTNLADDPADRRVVHMTDARKQMVFYLEVKSTEEPEQQPATRRKIGGSIYLMDSPFILDFVLPGIRSRKRRALHHVRELKHDADCESCCKRNDRKSDERL